MSTTKIALVTGGNKGIGLETARQLGALGYTIILGARQKALGEAAAAQLRDERIAVTVVELDVTKPATIAATVKLVDEKFGHLDALINNAGIADWASTPSGTSPESLRNVFDTNFFGLIELTQALLPLLKKAPAARIVNLSSILGSLTHHADPKSPIYAWKTLGYNASKAALNAFTVHLAYELRDTPIKVNSAHPGWVKTDLGGADAPMDLVTGAKTSVALATLPADGPTGAFQHLGETVPW